MSFTINRGTNISHWLRQNQSRGEIRRAWFTETDVKRIAGWGFDHFRLPIDESQLWLESGEQDSEAFDLMDAALDWAERAGFHVVVDLHILRSHHFNQTREPALFTHEAEVERFTDLWRQLSRRLKPRSTDRVAYELMNEPAARQTRDWNRVAGRVLRILRNLEPERTLLLGSNQGNSVFTFDELAVPDDENLLLTFHYYHPMLLTHHRASWWKEGGDYHGPVHYPGHPLADQDLAGVDEPLRGVLAELNQPYGREAMSRDLAQPLARSKQTGCPLYCGEFGVYNQVPDPLRIAWYRDLLQVFAEHGIAWANWDYKGDFGLVDRQGNPTGILSEVLNG
ncbi:MAG: cellulase family glycosylhydrolase [Kiritimatiellae bacterium]|jgi:endoglucanase|nr:cellulase family glycosylhydrolase [Kiritimatiellia bacterium]